MRHIAIVAAAAAAPQNNHLRKPPPPAKGIFSVSLFFLQYVSGVVTFLFPTPPALKRAARPLHAFCGAGAYIGAAVAAAMGIAEKTGFGGRRGDATVFTDDAPDYNPAAHYNELKPG